MVRKRRGKWYYYRGDPRDVMRRIREERELRKQAQVEMRRRSRGRRPPRRTEPTELIIWDGPSEFEGLKAERKKELEMKREK